jgi:hypothetical protein
MDCNLVALEKMVAYKHWDMVMKNHLKDKKINIFRFSFARFSSNQVLLPVVDHQLMEPMVVVLVDMVVQHLLHTDYSLKRTK